MQEGRVFDSREPMGRELCNVVLFGGWELIDGWNRAQIVQWHTALVTKLGNVRQSINLCNWLGGIVSRNKL